VKLTECPYYEKGFCKNGNKCKNAHTPVMLCENYILGFCPKGPACEFKHVKDLICPEEDTLSFLSSKGQKYFITPADKKAICHKCGEVGHKSVFCTSTAPITKDQL
jgi:cleavage and polyadenylation specificity factor subunit 4